MTEWLLFFSVKSYQNCWFHQKGWRERSGWHFQYIDCISTIGLKYLESCVWMYGLKNNLNQLVILKAARLYGNLTHEKCNEDLAW